MRQCSTLNEMVQDTVAEIDKDTVITQQDTMNKNKNKDKHKQKHKNKNRNRNGSYKLFL